jgi:adenylate cyclase
VRPPYTVVVALPYAVVYHSIASVRRVVVVAVLVAIAIAIAAGVLLARRMTRPIAALVAFAHDLSQRRFDQRVTVRSYDELGLLGDALERAARDLQASEIQIREEQAIRGDLRRYLPAPLVDQIVERKRSLALGGERREISVLFADVVGFTPLAERQSAETVVALLNELFTILTEIVFRHGGTVDKFIGDCVMAVWGASELQPDHAERAVAAARDMQRWRQVGNEMWRERYGVEIELAIGVNSGEAIVGNFGSETRMEFTAIGDVVNVAARLEAIARPNQILATAATHSRVEDKRDWASLGVRPIVGKAQPIELYEVRA